VAWRFAQVFANVRPGRMLDVGAGIGTFLAIARDAGWAPNGTEVSTTAIEKAQAIHGIGLIRGFVEDATRTASSTRSACGTLSSISGPLRHPTPPPHAHRSGRPSADSKAQRQRRGVPPDKGQQSGAPNPRTDSIAAIRAPAARHGIPYPALRPETVGRLLAATGFRVRSVSVDNAAPTRTTVGAITSRSRLLLTSVTPWNSGREMLVIAEPSVPTASPMDD